MPGGLSGNISRLPRIILDYLEYFGLQVDYVALKVDYLSVQGDYGGLPGITKGILWIIFDYLDSSE